MTEWTKEDIRYLKKRNKEGASTFEISQELKVKLARVTKKLYSLGLGVGTAWDAWSDKEEKQLEDVWPKGLEASVIGKMMGKSKCAIIGKANRMGLADRRPRRRYLTDHKPVLDSSIVRNIAVLDGQHQDDSLSIIQLGENQCKFPVGSKFCGHKTSNRDHGVYCAPHAERCYTGLGRSSFRPVRTA